MGWTHRVCLVATGLLLFSSLMANRVFADTKIKQFERSQIIRCTVSGKGWVEIKQRLTLLLPPSRQELDLWALTPEYQPYEMLMLDIGVGEIRVESLFGPAAANPNPVYYNDPETFDLTILTPRTSISLVAFWVEGILNEPNLILVKITNARAEAIVHLPREDAQLKGSCEKL